MKYTVQPLLCLWMKFVVDEDPYEDGGLQNKDTKRTGGNQERKEC